MGEGRLEKTVGVLSQTMVHCLRDWSWSSSGLGAGGVGLGVLGQIHGFWFKVLGVAVSGAWSRLHGSSAVGVLGSRRQIEQKSGDFSVY